MLGAAVINVAFPIMMGGLGTSSGGWMDMVLIIAVPGILLGMLRFSLYRKNYVKGCVSGSFRLYFTLWQP
jgi:hypothetical protein